MYTKQIQRKEQKEWDEGALQESECSAWLSRSWRMGQEGAGAEAVQVTSKLSRV